MKKEKGDNFAILVINRTKALKALYSEIAANEPFSKSPLENNMMLNEERLNAN